MPTRIRINVLHGDTTCRHLEVEPLATVKDDLINGDGELQIVYFDSMKEVNAFILGINSARGWEDSVLINDAQADQLKP